MNSLELSEFIKKYYETNPSGGNCHIVLDDNNINDSAIHFCIEKCKAEKDKDGLFIMEQMLKMRKTARGKSIGRSKK